MNPIVAYVLGIILAIAGTVAAFIMVIPEKKRPGLSKFLQWIHDLFNFKEFWLEKIIKALYVFSTLSCICVGFFLLFSGYKDMWYGRFHSLALTGILVMVLGPIVVRITFEFSMMFIMLVKNVMSINKKLDKDSCEVKTEEKPAENMVYCTQCGTRYDANKGPCPNCTK